MASHEPDQPAPSGCHHPSAETLAATKAEDIVDCPVMPGSTVIKSEAEAAGLYRDYLGQRYWLCCETCGPMFDEDPAAYATVGLTH
ncbi:hypothetical protein [Natronoglycomyces albus]|uniref:YHS domain-containing protein n=1 Tax=Natronoglycomyces albus TaxID=2811108 RepID=A0A895XR08_9ACTN|nr:hypothetical protein [Natronoglycomyces albus]QSB04996.1 hypothetical protein JQS30_14710 [Natronoglycomyces albus]